MAEIKEAHVVAKLQCVGYKGYIKDICESARELLQPKGMGLLAKIC